MATSFAASTLWSANVATGLRMAVVRVTFANTYATASNTFSAATYGGFDTIHAINADSRSLPGYKVDCGVSTTTVTPNLYRCDASGVPAIVADGVTIGDNKYAYLTILGT